MYSVVWCAVMCCNVMWCGVMCCDVLQCDVVWCAVVWSGAVQCSAMWCECCAGMRLWMGTSGCHSIRSMGGVLLKVLLFL